MWYKDLIIDHAMLNRRGTECKWCIMQLSGSTVWEIFVIDIVMYLLRENGDTLLSYIHLNEIDANYLLICLILLICKQYLASLLMTGLFIHVQNDR